MYTFVYILQAGVDVVGAYMSPVNDSYGKKGLLDASHRLNMCRMASHDSDMIMVRIK